MAAITSFVQDLDLYKTEKPYIYDGPEIEGFPKTNVKKRDVAISLADVRTAKDFVPTIEDTGFCFINSPSKVLKDDTDDSTSQPYAEEVVALLKEFLGADDAYAQNVRFRSADTAHGKTPPGIEAHIDLTAEDTWSRMCPFFTEEEQEKVLSGKLRARIINVWRPMVNPAEDYPLAFLDPHSIGDINDVVAIDRIFPGGSAEVSYLKHSPEHRWYWLSNMTPDEAAVFIQYDTHPLNKKFNRIGHTAFRNELARPGCPPRQSVEARILVLSPPPYENEITLDNPPAPESRVQPWKKFVQVAPRVKAVASGKERKMQFGYKPEAAQAIKV